MPIVAKKNPRQHDNSFTFFSWRTPLLWEWFCLLMSGVLTQVGQVCLTKSRQAERDSEGRRLASGLSTCGNARATASASRYSVNTTPRRPCSAFESPASPEAALRHWSLPACCSQAFTENPSRPKSSRRRKPRSYDCAQNSGRGDAHKLIPALGKGG
jgi:hypothetical protein